MDSKYKPVQRGSMWDSHQPCFSGDTKNLLQEMMKESRLTNFQQRKINESIHKGMPLPRGCHPTSSPYADETKRTRRPTPKKSGSGLRTREQCMTDEAYKRDKFIPAPKVDRDKQKEKLINKLVYGTDDLTKINVPPVESREEDPAPRKDRFDELWDEIEERQEFLQTMQNLGQGAKYEKIISTEISQKIREMEVLDKRRTAELQTMLKNPRKSSEN